MKCRKCGGKAAIDLKAHNIALCRDDFFGFFERRVERTIEKYRLFAPGETIAVAVSGGKDSLALMYVLDKMGFSVRGIYVNLGIPGYSDLSAEKCRRFSAFSGQAIHQFHLPGFFGDTVAGLARRAKRVSCSLCGIVKRYVMNRFAFEHGCAALATGHNLDDESSALLGNLINFDRGYLSKEKLVLPSRAMTAKKVKPFSLISEREIAAYALLRGIDYIHDECPFARGATSLNYKSALNMIEENSPGTKLRFLKGFMQNADIFSKEKNDGESDDKFCGVCGFLTYKETCNFCGLAEKSSVSQKMRGDFREYCPKLDA